MEKIIGIILSLYYAVILYSRLASLLLGNLIGLIRYDLLLLLDLSYDFLPLRRFLSASKASRKWISTGDSFVRVHSP